MLCHFFYFEEMISTSKKLVFCYHFALFFILCKFSLFTDVIKGVTEECALTAEDKQLFPNCNGKIVVNLTISITFCHFFV